MPGQGQRSQRGGWKTLIRQDSHKVLPQILCQRWLAPASCPVETEQQLTCQGMHSRLFEDDCRLGQAPAWTTSPVHMSSACIAGGDVQRHVPPGSCVVEGENSCEQTPPKSSSCSLLKQLSCQLRSWASHECSPHPQHPLEDSLCSLRT